MNHSELKFIKEIDGIGYYLFKPTFGHWYFKDYPNYKKHSLSHGLRMMLEYLEGGYSIYYMIQTGKDNIAGYVTVAKGGRRLRCSTKQDIVLGPIYIDPELRGKGIGTRGIFAVLHHLDIQYENAYEYIQPTNTASIRTVEKNGYIKIGSGSSKGLLRRIDNDGSQEFFIYQYRN